MLEITCIRTAAGQFITGATVTVAGKAYETSFEHKGAADPGLTLFIEPFLRGLSGRFGIALDDAVKEQLISGEPFTFVAEIPHAR